MLLPLLFTIKISLSISLKRSVYLNIATQRSVILRHASGTTSATSSPTRYYDMLPGATCGTTRHYEVLPVVLRNTTRYYEWYNKVLRVVMRVTMWYYERLRYNEWFFRSIIPKLSFKKIVMKNFTKFTGNQL